MVTRTFTYTIVALLCLLILFSIGCSSDDDSSAKAMSNGDDDDLPPVIDVDDDDDDDDNDTVEPAITGQFDPMEQDGFYSMPFPIDLRLNDDMSIRVDDFPNPRNSAILNRYIDVGQRDARGFGANSGILFTFTGEINPASLPQTDAKSMSDTASAFIVSIDPAAPDYGKRYPYRYKYNANTTVYGPENLLVMLPVQGVAMSHGWRYAAVITTGVADTHGNPLGANDELALALNGESSVDKANMVFAPLAAYLDDNGMDKNEVAIATVFTTGKPLERMIALRDHVYAMQLPGIDPGTLKFEDEKDHYYFISGQITIPIYQKGEIPYVLSGGAIWFDDTGEPILQAMQTTRIALTIPKGTMPAGGWPLLLYSHGSGGSWKSFISKGVPTWLAKKGIAAASIDAPHHGVRNPISTDSAFESFCFYNALNPESFRDNNPQAAVELMAVQRQLFDLVIPESIIPEPEASKQDIFFEPNDTFFMGHSQGSTIGPLLVSVDPHIRAAYFSGAGASLMWNLLTKLLPVNVPLLLRLGLHLNEEEAAEQLDQFHPALNLIQHVAEMVDPTGYNPYFASLPVPGASPKDVFQGQGITDTYVGLPCHGAFAAAARMDIIEPLLDDDAWERVQLTDGVLLEDTFISGNREDYNGDPVTSALVQYPAPPDGSDGHYITFRFPAMHRRVACFFSTWLDNGIATVVDDNSDENASCY